MKLTDVALFHTAKMHTSNVQDLKIKEALKKISVRWVVDQKSFTLLEKKVHLFIKIRILNYSKNPWGTLILRVYCGSAIHRWSEHKFTHMNAENIPISYKKNLCKMSICHRHRMYITVSNFYLTAPVDHVLHQPLFNHAHTIKIRSM